ncbi:DUF4126 domain-containing protein [Gloeocapsa sp. PCC 73106]|uniref:DUF4126 domain-containing protein n=1 Tax=Gloeocapsa sp. PCC 73106 TaxID=102232 RepID=UPI0002AC3E72|nr:DUF4126 domain-containing protein [Gloeocapsa sp. PCC 73106]ELR96889.1 hypothetical protein GLO73106DRAFT_00006900 [Gloeocapsa sp. PCC 73106]
MLEILGSLSASAAVGMRVAVPLLVVGLLRTKEIGSDIPGLKYIHPQVLLSILIAWSLLELIFSKQLLGQRLLQTIQLIFSPIIGALLPFAVITSYDLNTSNKALYLMSIAGGSLALVIKLVEVGWFFRLRGLPLTVIMFEDVLSVLMVLFAFKAPQQGGLIAMLLMWIALRSSGEWRRWYIRSISESKSPID